MIIGPEFRIGQYKDDDHLEDPTHFSFAIGKMLVNP